jgi:Zn ribbon nucleic-acid-binding protein
MIFYGTKAKNLKKSKISAVTCPDCQANTDMNFSVYGKYAHIYWIPFFPISKIEIAECNSCLKTFDKKQFSDQIRKKIKINNETNPVRTPLWFFSGLAIVALLICTAVYTSKQTDKKEKEYIKNPKKGDIYSLNASKGFYTCIKVDSVTKDSVIFKTNKFEFDNKTGLDKIDKLENYTDLKVIYSKKDLINLESQDSIFGVVRK